MTDINTTPAATAPSTANRRAAAAGTLLPLWIAALSLAVIAVVLIIGSVELVRALHSTEASVAELQQQVEQLKSGLGGLLGG